MRRYLFLIALALVVPVGGTRIHAASFAPPLDTATAYWQFAAFSTQGTGVAGTGTLTADRNKTGTGNDVVDLAGSGTGTGSWVTRYFNGGANGTTVGNAVSVNAPNSDNLAATEAAGGYLIRDLSSAGEPLAPAANTSFSMYTRVNIASFTSSGSSTTGNTVDDILYVGNWNGANTASYELKIVNGKAEFTTNSAAGVTTNLLGSQTLSTGTWYDITGVFHSNGDAAGPNPGTGTMTLYVYNDQTKLLVGTASTPVNYASLLNNGTGNDTRDLLFFGRPSLSDGSPVGTKIEESAIWNSALSANQVALLTVPEPSSFVLGTLALAGLTAARARRLRRGNC